jgi:hypothetical protein
MKVLTREQLFAPGQRGPRKTKDWFERAKLVVAAARERAVETTQQRVVPSMKRFVPPGFWRWWDDRSTWKRWHSHWPPRGV